MKSMDGIVTDEIILKRIYNIFLDKVIAYKILVDDSRTLPKSNMPPGKTMPIGDKFDGIIRKSV